MRWLLLVALLTGCTKAPKRDKLPPPAPSAPAVVVPVVVPPALPPDAALAEGQCGRDDDCVVTTWAGCCECCTCDAPHAALRAEVIERREVCARKDCAKPRCEGVDCVPCAFSPEQDRPGKCTAGACVLP